MSERASTAAAASRRRLCLSEMSVTGSIACALGLTSLLWLAILAVI